MALKGTLMAASETGLMDILVVKLIGHQMVKQLQNQSRTG